MSRKVTHVSKILETRPEYASEYWRVNVFPPVVLNNSLEWSIGNLAKWIFTEATANLMSDAFATLIFMPYQNGFDLVAGKKTEVYLFRRV